MKEPFYFYLAVAVMMLGIGLFTAFVKFSAWWKIAFGSVCP